MNGLKRKKHPKLDAARFLCSQKNRSKAGRKGEKRLTPSAAVLYCG